MTETFADLLTRSFGLDDAELMEALRTLPVADASPLLVALRSLSQASAGSWAQEASLLTDEQVALLERGGLVSSRTAGAVAAADLVAAHGTLVREAFTTTEVANLLGVKDSRVRQRRADRSLWAIQNGNEWLFPALQFATEGIRRGQIRGLDRVLPELPESLHPLAVAGFLTTPQPGLLRKAELVTPLEWLVSGGDPQMVVEAAQAVEWTGV